MRRALLVLAAVLVTLPLMSSTIVVRRGSAAPKEEWNLLDDEHFDGVESGYDHAGWTELTSGSGVVDSDETVLCPADTGFDDDCLETSSAAETDRYFAAYPLAAPQGGPVYCRAYLNIVSIASTVASYSIIIAGSADNATNYDTTASQFRLRLTVTSSGALAELDGRCRQTNFGATTVTAGTTYLVEWYSNRAAVNDECDMKIDGVQKGPALASSPFFSADVTHIGIGNTTSTTQQADFVWDRVACDTDGWIGGI